MEVFQGENLPLTDLELIHRILDRFEVVINSGETLESDMQPVLMMYPFLQKASHCRRDLAESPAIRSEDN